jgi:gamma-glutamyltranspeptidase
MFKVVDFIDQLKVIKLTKKILIFNCLDFENFKIFQEDIYKEAAVVTEHPICSKIGKNILLKGGNAVDSAISSLLCIGVVNNFSSGIGG